MPVGRALRDWRSRPPRDDPSPESCRRSATTSREPFSSDFPPKNPRIFDNNDFFSGAFDSDLPDLLRSPRPPRRPDPRREARREPLGVYSDDMVCLFALLVRRAAREIPSRKSGALRCCARALRIPLKWRPQGQPQGT
jgi:hypothetical protein